MINRCPDSCRQPLWPIGALLTARSFREPYGCWRYSIIAFVPSLARSSFLKLAWARARASSDPVVKNLSPLCHASTEAGYGLLNLEAGPADVLYLCPS
jgi:hypothetical protein